MPINPDAVGLKVGVPGAVKMLELFALDGRRLRLERFETEEYFLLRNGLQHGAYRFVVRNSAGRLLATGTLIFD